MITRHNIVYRKRRIHWGLLAGAVLSIIAFSLLKAVWPVLSGIALVTSFFFAFRALSDRISHRLE